MAKDIYEELRKRSEALQEAADLEKIDLELSDESLVDDPDMDLSNDDFDLGSYSDEDFEMDLSEIDVKFPK